MSEINDLFSLTKDQIFDLDNPDIALIPKSNLLRFTIAQFKEMLFDDKYVYDYSYIHRIIDGKVHCDFGGSIVRFLMGPDWSCEPWILFELKWSPLVCQANLLAMGNIRDTMRRVDDKLFAKFFKSPVYDPLDNTVDIPQRLGQLEEMADYLQKAGF